MAASPENPLAVDTGVRVVALDLTDTYRAAAVPAASKGRGCGGPFGRNFS